MIYTEFYHMRDRLTCTIIHHHIIHWHVLASVQLMSWLSFFQQQRRRKKNVDIRASYTNRSVFIHPIHSFFHLHKKKSAQQSKLHTLPFFFFSLYNRHRAIPISIEFRWRDCFFVVATTNMSITHRIRLSHLIASCWRIDTHRTHNGFSSFLALKFQARFSHDVFCFILF